jgi:hypothetical protein
MVVFCTPVSGCIMYAIFGCVVYTSACHDVMDSNTSILLNYKNMLYIDGFWLWFQGVRVLTMVSYCNQARPRPRYPDIVSGHDNRLGRNS